MKCCAFTQHNMTVAMLRRNQYLLMVFIGKRKSLPISKCGRFFIVVDNYQIEFAVKTGDEFPRLAIAVDASEDVTG